MNKEKFILRIPYMLSVPMTFIMLIMASFAYFKESWVFFVLFLFLSISGFYVGCKWFNWFFDLWGIKGE